MTRLADVTRLDRIGVPVFQAVRPWARSLSVHQGKGLIIEAAQIGALMEAVEYDHSETFAAPTRLCAFHELPKSERAPTIADFAANAASPADPEEDIAWVEARRLLGDSHLWTPYDTVSMDFSRRGHARLQRSSNGVGAHFDLERAIGKALLEVIERDAEAEWLALPEYRRSLAGLDLASIPFAWFREIAERIAAAGLVLTIYHLATAIGVPAFLAEIVETEQVAGVSLAVFGAACHPRAETAVLGGLLEALQTRCSRIAGARDDIRYRDPDRSTPIFQGFGVPLPPQIDEKSWPAVINACVRRDRLSSTEMAQRLADVGYPDAAVIDLSRKGCVAKVVKVVVPGLGCLERRRRAPMAAR